MRFFLPKWPAKRRQLAQKSAKMCKKRFYAIPPFFRYPLLRVTEQYLVRKSPLKIPSHPYNLRSPCGIALSCFRDRVHAGNRNIVNRGSIAILEGPHFASTKLGIFRTVSEYCSACVSRVGLSTKQATEPYSDNLLNRTWNPSKPYSDKEDRLRRALRAVALLVGFSTGNPPKIGTFSAWNRTRNRTRTPPEFCTEQFCANRVAQKLLHVCIKKSKLYIHTCIHTYSSLVPPYIYIYSFCFLYICISMYSNSEHFAAFRQKKVLA